MPVLRKRITSRSMTLMLAIAMIGRAAAASPASADPAPLDPTFGVGGVVITDVLAASDIATDGLVLPDGRIMVCGIGVTSGTNSSFLLLRYLPSGVLDSNFGTSGVVAIGFGGTSTGATCLARQSDGKLVVGGSFTSGGNRFTAIVRVDSAGALDPSFGTGGKVAQLVGPIGDVDDLLIQPDGKVVIAGSFRVSGTTTYMGLRRYDSNGVIDGGFGVSGTVTRGPGTDNHAYAIALQPDGKLVAVGITDLGGGLGAEFLTFRFKPNGTPDSTFASFGRAITDVSGLSDIARSVAIMPGGRILVGGYTGLAGNTSQRFAVARFRSDGVLDTGFDGDGIALSSVVGATGYTFLEDMTLLTSGRILLGGQTTNLGTSDDFALARMDSTGAMDTTFGTAGISTLDPSGGGRDYIQHLAWQSDGRFIAIGQAGGSLFPNGPRIALARYLDSERPVAVPDPAYHANGYELAPGAPNPFRGSTCITFRLPEAAFVQLRVFDAQGRAIHTLVSRRLESGTHSIDWSGAGPAGAPVPFGLYLCRLETRGPDGLQITRGIQKLMRLR